MEQSILVITGHPRSGTSFTASLLQSAGLYIGQHLMAPGHGNVRGFFEDLDVVGFHEAVLRSQDINHVGWTVKDNIPVSAFFVNKAKEVISNNADIPVWGWKDPRTTLFLDFWEKMLPKANFLFLYRAPWEVADSIYRRGDEMFVEEPGLAIKIWINYNRQLLNFYKRFPDRCYLTSIYNVSEQAPSFINAINSKFKLSLETPATDLYERSLLHTQVSHSHHPSLVNGYFPEAIDIYEKLNAVERQQGLNPDQAWKKNIESNLDPNWAFQDWIKIRRLEKKVKSLQHELEKAQTEINSINNNNMMTA